MGLPIRVFWFMNNTIHRVVAEQDMRALTVANAAQSAEGTKEHRERLVVSLGEVIKHDGPPPVENLDRAGLQGLKGLL